MVQSDAESVEARCDHLTPLDAVAKVIYTLRPSPDITGDDARLIASAALLALAEAAYPESVHLVGAKKIHEEPYAYEVGVADDVFRSMLREIAGESK